MALMFWVGKDALAETLQHPWKRGWVSAGVRAGYASRHPVEIVCEPRAPREIEPPADRWRQMSEDRWRENVFSTSRLVERQMFTAEPSYFNFLMEHRCARRARFPFGQAAGAMPELPCGERPRRPQRDRAVSLNGGHFPRRNKKPGR
jgi:hypothetical protein